METNEEYAGAKKSKQHNVLPIYGNEATMNLNPLILANIQGSSYFKVTLFKLKTYHEVVDEIYYQVKHLEPWERGSRKTSGQTGMCGGVRGVGAGGIVSTAFCLLYKLYTLRLTRKQVNGLLNHSDSPYIRALGFMYIRYTQPPGDLYDWYEDYFLDEEEVDVKAGGGQTMTIGQMAYQFLTKLDWFSTLFPRIPVPIQKQIEKKVELYCRSNSISLHQLTSTASASSVDTTRRNNYSGPSSTGRSRDESADYDKTVNYRDRNETYFDSGRGRDDRPARDIANSSKDDRDYGVADTYREKRKKAHQKSRSRSGERKQKKKHRHRERSRSRESKHGKHYSKERVSYDKNRERSYDKKYY